MTSFISRILVGSIFAALCLPALVNASTLIIPKGVDCSRMLLPMTPAVAMDAAKVNEHGVMSFRVNYTTDKQGERHIELPGAILSQVDIPKLRVVVLAGNSGTQYEDTRHSLAFVFGEYLRRQLDPMVSDKPNYKSREEVEITYDNNTTRSWTTDFYTEAPHFRTKNGEIFIFPYIDGESVLMVKMLGDYNEIGDFAVSIMDALKVSPDRVLLIHDELGLAEGQFAVEAGEVQKYRGNNSVFSMIRNLSYGIFDQVVHHLQNDLKISLDAKQVEELRAAFRASADIRYQGHLGDDNLYNSAFKNKESILVPLNPLIRLAVDSSTTDLKQQFNEAKSAAGNAKKEIGPIMKALQAPEITAEQKQELLDRKEEIFKAAEPMANRAKELETQIANLEKQIKDGTRKIIEDRLRFDRLMIGTDNGTLGPNDSKPDFVLAPYDPKVFNDGLWVNALEQLKAWLKR